VAKHSKRRFERNGRDGLGSLNLMKKYFRKLPNQLGLAGVPSMKKKKIFCPWFYFLKPAASLEAIPKHG